MNNGENNIFKIDKYGFRARIIPAIVAIVFPIFVFSHFYINPELSAFFEGFRKFSLVGDVAISTVVMFYLSQYGRIIGKNVFEKKYFKGELQMPTTQFLLYKNPVYSSEYKKKIGTKIFDDFGIKLASSQQEQKDELTSRTKIVEAMSHIRKRLFANKFLLQHNIEYGAMRNTIGCGVIGFLISLINILFFQFVYHNNIAVVISLVTIIIYSFLILVSKWIINAYGEAYAKILLREYMSS